MSPRSNRPRRPGRSPRRAGRRGASAARGRGAGLGGPQQVVDREGVTWQVRQVTGDPAAGGRGYRCPGCQQQVPAGSPHTVTWPVDAMQGVENRRHWHTVCWRARDRRHPGGAWA